MSYVENSVQNENEGLTFVELAAGEFKEAGNPNKPLSETERERFERDLDIVHRAFIDAVARYREVPREDIVAVADGHGYTGVEAKEKNLVDGLGGRQAAREHFASALGTTPDQIVFCEYTPSDWWL
jgi:protease-4